MSQKYKINYFLSIQPRNVTVASVEKILSNEHGISRSTFMRDRSIKHGSDHSITIDRLEVYAALFDVTVDELKNYTPEHVKPLNERKPSETMKKIIKKTGLTK